MHSLICGVTESGKTTLAHALADALDSAGQNIIVFDPVGTKTAAGKWPENAIVFDDEGDFFAYLARDDVFHAHVFVDESGEVFNLSKRENFWLLTRGRHFGFNVYCICQRPKMIAPTIRNQCSKAYVFRLAQDDLEEIGRDFGFSNLKNEVLDTGDFLLLLSGTSQKKRANVFQLLNSPKG